MSKRYEPQNIEKKWQKIWQDEKAFAATNDYSKPKYYALVEFPNYAIKNHIHPKIVTKNNVHRFKEQLHSLGYSFDWDREINTTDPEYYHWTQWIFLKLFKAGLAYQNGDADQLVYLL